MHPSLAAVLAALFLTGCAGYHGTQTVEHPTTADMVSTFPSMTNDGFYDGGVFDEDLVDLDPIRPN